MRITKSSQEKNKKKNYKKVLQKVKRQIQGITLIALVVTIIVLLILAGVALSLTVGNNGLFTRAENAADTWQMASEDELRKMTILEAATNLETYLYADKNGDNATIPAGFAVSQVKGENTVDDGLVIIDSYGNEYVWIEVPKTTEVYQTTGLDIIDFTESDYEKIETDLHLYTSIYRNNTNRTDTYNTVETTGLTEDEYNLLKQKMLKSIYQNGGFWIGRYETGISKPRKDNTEVITDKIMSQKNLYPLTWITCSEAQKLASNVKYGNYTSSLMFGIQWDLTLKYLEIKGSNQEELVEDSSSWGNYINSEFKLNRGKYTRRLQSIDALWYDYTESFEHYVLETIKQSNSLDDGYAIKLTTGAADVNCKNNIYDLAGNVRELTLENSTSTYNVSRGGSYELLGSQFTARNRNDDLSGAAVGMRISLF